METKEAAIVLLTMFGALSGVLAILSLPFYIARRKAQKAWLDIKNRNLKGDDGNWETYLIAQAIRERESNSRHLNLQLGLSLFNTVALIFYIKGGIIEGFDASLVTAAAMAIGIFLPILFCMLTSEKRRSIKREVEGFSRKLKFKGILTVDKLVSIDKSVILAADIDPPTVVNLKQKNNNGV